MFKRFILFTALAASSLSGFAQNALYMPRDIQNAFKKGTRSPDGKPGKNYWQNHARYDIHVTAAPPNRNIKGTESITYFNDSPDTLRSLNMKLILNVHRPGAVRLSPAQPDYLTSGMQIDTFTVNGQQSVAWNNEQAAATNQRVRLAKPLLPHDSLKLNIAWHYEISKESNREGMIDATTYYLAYFYPRVSVYDDYNGWDYLPFNDALEFYNDFNDYNLKVTVPANYLVWATGTLQNAAQVLQPEYAKRLQASFTSDSTIHVATAQDLAAKKITKPGNNTWIWTSNHITDVALGLSDHYVWDAASVVVDKATGRRASMQAAFADSSADFHHSVQNGRNSLSYFSTSWPGVPYPFPKMTAFQGFADMEYPMMVNDSHTDDLRFAQFVQDHEIAHTYFPFYMGINETRYGYMDEGWATTFEYLIGKAEVGQAATDKLYKNFRVNRWVHDPSSYEDLPIITPTSELNMAAGNNEYGKASLSYLALKDMLGDELFKKALHTYMDNWHGKHPIPWDYFNSMNAGSGRNLNWFFNNWFFTNGYIDLAVDNVAKTKTGVNITIKNIGGFAAPFDAVITYTNGSSDTLHRTSAFWESNQKQATLALKNTKAVKSVKLDGGIFMDADENNNTWNAK
ncbi:M1 family metallopeptidase [Mucilaginibacter sp. CSA2-8R]|uniref:M1 family metallopeptidase n=1 Tax=Mucilaginibacter sp. CSA2-8R TaxID=3141542 RepID=UPI00315D6915